MQVKAGVYAFCAMAAFAACGDIAYENGNFRFVLGDDARAKSLVVKGTGEEMLVAGEGLPLFALTQPRPFNNELKLD